VGTVAGTAFFVESVPGTAGRIQSHGWPTISAIVTTATSPTAATAGHGIGKNRDGEPESAERTVRPVAAARAFQPRESRDSSRCISDQSSSFSEAVSASW
jgi:hypothetical protein